MANRIYVVEPLDAAADERLVRATHRGQALAHVAELSYRVRVATQDDLVRLLDSSAVESAIGLRKPQEAET